MPTCYTNDPEELSKTMPIIDHKFFVKCVETDDFVIVKTPHLPNRQLTNNGRISSLGFHRNYFYAKEVNRAILETVTNQNRFNSVNICVLSAYQNLPNFGTPDNDNLDSKTVIDAITEALEVGDEATKCSLFLHSFSSNSIADGAYFVVSEGAGKCPDIDKILAILEQCFPAKTT